MQETQVLSLGQEDVLWKEMATHCSTFACEIAWAEEPGGLQSMGSQRVGLQDNISNEVEVQIVILDSSFIA